MLAPVLHLLLPALHLPLPGRKIYGFYILSSFSFGGEVLCYPGALSYFTLNYLFPLLIELWRIPFYSCSTLLLFSPYYGGFHFIAVLPFYYFPLLIMEDYIL